MSVDDAAPALAIDGLAKRYGSHVVLDDLSLTVDRGEIFGLIGLNGVGKTTLIKLVLDLVRADRGAARLFGKDTSAASSRGNVSYLPEAFRPSRLLNGWEYLSLALAYYNRKLDQLVASSAARALALDPDQLAGRIGTYSKGTAQKLGVLGALLPKRPLVILDEPMSGLDPEARAALKTCLVSEAKDGRAVFFSSHVLSDVDEICDRIGVLHEGQMIFTGAVDAFRDLHPESNLERSFLTAIGRL